MTDQQLYCDGPDCDRPVAGHGQGKCQSHLKQLQRTGKCTPIAEKKSAEERAVDAGTAMLEADSDEDYSARRRAFLSACKALGGKAEEDAASIAVISDEMRARRSLLIRIGLKAARARGARLGRPLKADPSEIETMFERLKSSKLVAIALDVSVSTVNRRRGQAQKPDDFEQAAASPPST